MSQCVVCSKELSRRNTIGYCRPCWAKSPEKRAKTAKAMVRRWQDPELRSRMREAGIANLNGPGVRDRAIASIKARRSWEVASAHLTPEVRAKAVRRSLETKLAHIPRELRAEYKRLTRKKKFSAAEAAEFIRNQHERDMAQFRAKILRGVGDGHLHD
jgi:hypothetical protein